MKKTIILSLVGALFCSSLLATDTTSLTRATVKLIQNQNEFSSRIEKLENSSTLESKNINSHNKNLSENNQKIENNLESISKNASGIKDINSKISLMEGDIEQVRSEAERSLLLSQETARTLDKINKISGDVQQKSEMVETATNDMSVKAKNIRKEIILNSNEINYTNKNVEINTKNITNNKSDLAKLDAELREIKLSIKKTNQIMDEKINSLKVIYDAELKIMKAQLEKARPILMTNSSAKNHEVSHSVKKSGKIKANKEKCVSISKEEEELIESFLRK